MQEYTNWDSKREIKKIKTNVGTVLVHNGAVRVDRIIIDDILEETMLEYINIKKADFI